MLQSAPFQCSVSPPYPASPTAHTSLLDTAATSMSRWDQSGFGLGTMRQFDPSQCSVSVAPPSISVSNRQPTAHASVRETDATPVNAPFTGGSDVARAGEAADMSAATSATLPSDRVILPTASDACTGGAYAPKLNRHKGR